MLDEGKTGRRTAGPARRFRPGPTPIRVSKRTRTVLVLAAVAVSALVMWQVPAVPLTVVGGFALALVLSFPVRALSRLMPRGLAIFVSFLFVIGLILVGMLILVPLLVQQLGALISALPGLAADAERYTLARLDLLDEAGFLPVTSEEMVSILREDLSDGARVVAENALGGLFGYVTETFSFALSLFGMVFIAAYLLADVRKLRAAYLLAVPARYRRDARDLWDAFGFSLSRYLSGLALVIAIQGTLSALVLYLLGVPYALALGAWVSLMALIPLLGAWLGAIPALIVAFTISPTTALLTALLFLALHQLEGNFLAPRIHGQTLSVHPILVFLAIIIGGGLAGVFGVLFAVPTLAVLRVLFDFFRLRLYTDSEDMGREIPEVREPAGVATEKHLAAEGGPRDDHG